MKCPQKANPRRQDFIIVAKGWEEALMNTGFILGGREGASKKCSEVKSCDACTTLNVPPGDSIVCFRRVNFKFCELYLRRVIKKERTGHHHHLTRRWDGGKGERVHTCRQQTPSLEMQGRASSQAALNVSYRNLHLTHSLQPKNGGGQCSPVFRVLS